MIPNSDDNLIIGKITGVHGSHITAELDSKIDELSKIYEGSIYPIGQFGSILKVYFGRKIIYAHVSGLKMKEDYANENFSNKIIDFTYSQRILEANLFGEGEWLDNGELKFERGVSTFPLPQQKIYLTTKTELSYIFEKNKLAKLNIGHHVGAKEIVANIDLNELLNKHSAVLGSTGSGKSGTVSAIIHGILEYNKGSTKNWQPNIIILDPHNEYSSAFEENNCDKISTDQENFKLPYWLFNFQETVNLLIGKTEFAAISQSNILKKALQEAKEKSKHILNISDDITVDSPVPYCLDELKSIIDSDKSSQSSKQGSHLKILEKLEILRNDSRYNFMMNNWNQKSDEFCDIIKKIVNGNKPLKIIDLSGVPNEVAGIVSAVIARVLFSIKVWQKPDERKRTPLLLVCEEAHRYVPNKGEAQYEAAQESIKRIAKEGRKYGIGLMLVSQRPSEVEATVLSQCNSWIVLRTTNETDASYIKSMLPDSLSSLTKVLSNLRQREAIIIGQAITIPARVLIRELTKEQLPRSNDIKFDEGWCNLILKDKEIKTILDRWRFQKKEK